MKMGCCSGKCILVTICLLQLISTVERQVFDFLGYMWAPIIGNFLQIIFVIIGLFGAIQFRHRVVIVYTVWCLVWLGWNIFVICFYLEVGILKRGDNILNMGTGNKSWWIDHGIGCTVTNNTYTANSGTGERPIPAEDEVEGCLIQYYYVEIIHAGIQCLLALIGFCVSCYVIYVFTEEDDSSQLVHDELEYIKMRYRSPARSSFRDPPKQQFLNMNKAYDTITPTKQTSTYTDPVNSTTPTSPQTVDNTTAHPPANTGGPEYHSDDSLGPLPTNSVSSQRKILLGSSESKRKARKQQLTEEPDVGRQSPPPPPPPENWGTGRSQGSGKNVGGGQSIPDFGYESYDSRHQLVVGHPQGQTVI